FNFFHRRVTIAASGLHSTPEGRHEIHFGQAGCRDILRTGLCRIGDARAIWNPFLAARRPMSNFTSPPIWSDDIAGAANEVSWLWDGFLAAGNLTLLTSLWKSGKTTLVSLLLNRRIQGGELLGRAVRPGATVVVSEEPLSLWAMRARRLDVGPRVCFFCRPFDGRPDLPAWRGFIDQLLDLHATRGIDLVIVDPLALFLPAHEGSGPSLLKALQELQRLTERGLAVLLLHHPPKGEPRLGQAARGSGVLPAFADILLEMRVPQGDPATRRRRLHGFSRYPETPQHLLIELTAASDDYTVLAATADDD